MDYKLLNEAMILYEQEQSQEQSTPDCQHDFDYYFTDGERVCLKCNLIDPSPKLMASPDYLCYTPRSKPDKYAYLKKCIAEHEEQHNCSIPYDVNNAFKRFQLCFIRMFPNEQKISVRYTLFRLAQLYGHSCPETAFINIKLPKTRERYEQICSQVLKEI